MSLMNLIDWINLMVIVFLLLTYDLVDISELTALLCVSCLPFEQRIVSFYLDHHGHGAGVIAAYVGVSIAHRVLPTVLLVGGLFIA